MSIPPQTAGMSTASDATLPILDDNERGLAVLTATDVPASQSELRTQILPPIQDLVPFIPEVSRTPSPAPDSEDPPLQLPVLVARDGPPPEQEASEDTRTEHSSTDSESDSESLSVVDMDTNAGLSASLHPVHRYIPLDVTNNIIASFDASSYYDPEERVTVWSCALVCKDWLPASRRCLFPHVAFWESPTRYDLFVSRVLRSEHMQPWLTRVRELTFRDHSLTRDKDDTKTKPVEERGHRLVHDFSGRFPNLLYLYFSNVDWSGCPGHPLVYLTFFKQLHCLQELYLEQCRFPSFYAFWRTVAALPSLRHLALSYVSWPSETVRPPIFSLQLGDWPKLHAFQFTSLGETPARTLLSWLSQTSSLSSIRSVSCDPVHLAENPEFLQSICTSVTEILLCDGSVRVLAEDAFSSCSRLESLELRGVQSSEWGKLAVILQNTPSRLRQLTIEVSFEEIDIVEADGNHGLKCAEGLELVDAVLDRDNFANLEFVRFNTIDAYIQFIDNVYHQLRAKKLKRMIVEAWEKKLAKLYARGIMELKKIYIYPLEPRDTKSPIGLEDSKTGHTSDENDEHEEERRAD